MSETPRPRKDSHAGPNPSPDDVPRNRPTWGRGRPVWTPLLGAVLALLVVLAVFAFYTVLR